MRSYRLFILCLLLAGILGSLSAQPDKKTLSTTPLLSPKKDTVRAKTDTSGIITIKKDTVPKHNPRIATRRSAIIPGWGQAYNKEYWKIPIVYGILAIPVGFYFYNNSYYKKTKFAFEARFNESQGDSSGVSSIDPELVNLSLSSLQNYRNSFRRDRDYSILWFLVAWALQVADATVFAHLKQFDVTGDLSMEVNPSFNQHTGTPGLSLTMSLKNPVHKPVNTR